MKGTAILFKETRPVTILEDVDKSLYNEIKKQCGCQQCNCSIDNKNVEFGQVSPVMWHEEEVDWDYGY
ncbi:hypothetical protein ACSVDA_23675 [Cytobacillus sp. Hm23]